MTLGDDQGTEQDTNDDEDHGQAMSDVQKSIAVEEPKDNHVCPVGSLLT